MCGKLIIPLCVSQGACNIEYFSWVHINVIISIETSVFKHWNIDIRRFQALEHHYLSSSSEFNVIFIRKYEIVATCSNVPEFKHEINIKRKLISVTEYEYGKVVVPVASCSIFNIPFTMYSPETSIIVKPFSSLKSARKSVILDNFQLLLDQLNFFYPYNLAS